jgi:probable phosphoglycerate mutase
MLSSPEPSSERTIYLLRHGELSIEPGGKRYIGQTDLPLSPAGVRQAEQWGGFFRGIPLTAVFSSDLQRALHMARIIALGHGVEVSITPALSEVGLGAWEGLSFAEVRQSDPHAYEQRGRDPAGHRPPGGESFHDLQKRVVPAFEEAIHSSTGDVVMVGHAGVNRVLLCHLLGIPLANLFRFDQDHGALNIIVKRAAGYRVRAVNQRMGWCVEPKTK